MGAGFARILPLPALSRSTLIKHIRTALSFAYDWQGPLAIIFIVTYLAVLTVMAIVNPPAACPVNVCYSDWMDPADLVSP